MRKSTQAAASPFGAEAPRPPTVAIVGTDAVLARRLRQLLDAPASGVRAVVGRDLGADLVVALEPHGSPDEVARRIGRTAARGLRAPLLVVVPRAAPELRAAVLDAGADDCLGAGVGGDELRARVRALLRRCARDRAASPLTGLPGNVQLEQDLRIRIANRAEGALMAFDLRDFKPFNDRYGYVRGDEVLRLVARLLVAAADVAGREGPARVYHIGGDDFFVIAHPSQAAGIAAAAISGFGDAVRRYYDVEDIARGHISGVDRTGRPAQFPLMGLAVAAVAWRADEAPPIDELARGLAAAKETIRKRRGSAFVCRRSTAEGSW